MKFQFPAYYPQFRCAAGACLDTCCACWQVVIDPQTLRTYQTLPGALGETLRMHLRQDAGDAWYLAFSESARGCPMQAENGLCRLQSAFGEGALSQVCQRYPRFCYEFGSRTEQGLCLSCPTACQLILSTPFRLCSRTTDAPPALNDIDPARYFAFLQGRETAFRLAENADFSVYTRTALLLLFAQELEQAVQAPDAVLEKWRAPTRQMLPLSSTASGSFSELRAVFSAMEPLTERYPPLLARCICAPQHLPAQTAQRILTYYLYKYFLQAAYDGRLLEKVQFAAASLLMLEALLWPMPPNPVQRIRCISLFSRETEHSEENLTQFFSWAGKSRQPLLLSLLLQTETGAQE